MIVSHDLNPVRKIVAIMICCLVCAYPLKGQNDEYMFIFSHTGIGSFYVNAMEVNGQYYLPMGELFSLLSIHFEKGENGLSFQGVFPVNNPYIIKLDPPAILRGRETHLLQHADIYIGEMDLFLLPEVFEHYFGLRFTVNLTTMGLSLQSDHLLPAEERLNITRARRNIPEQHKPVSDYPMLFPRNRRILGGGMLDYAFGFTKNNLQHGFNYTLTGGMELLGGDLQGSVMGNNSDSFLQNRANGISWRYVLADNPYLTQVYAGQLTSTGLHRQRIHGVAISNEPIMPRRIYENYIVDGTTVPESEVELYVNNTLVAMTIADEMGYYHFNHLLNYGTVRLSVRIYKPSGEIVIKENQIQIPYTFLPQGTVAYNIQGGRADHPLNFGKGLSAFAMHGDVAYGVVNGLTAKAGVELPGGNDQALWYAGLSARLFKQYLLNMLASPGYMYQVNSSVLFPSRRSINASFAEYERNSIYNSRQIERETALHVNIPFYMGALQSGIRFGAEHRKYNHASITNARIDLHLRAGRLSMRLNYRERLTSDQKNTGVFENGIMTAAVSCNYDRSAATPLLLRGMYLLAQSEFIAPNMEIQSISLQLSRNIAQKGRMQISAKHHFRLNTVTVQATLNVDLTPVRASSQIVGQINGYQYFQQNFSGSLALDGQSNRVLASNRRQVGQSAASVIAFVDANNNGRFDPGEEKVPLNNIQIDLGTIAIAGKDTIMRLTQLQPYWIYNARLIHGSIPNPTLVSIHPEFAFVTDPNRFKQIEIPLYRAGIVSGQVRWENEETAEGAPGMRLFLKCTDNQVVNTIRTFSDGSYYAMSVLPGTYSIQIDPVQLEFLGKFSNPPERTFNVMAHADGDQIENLDFFLTDSPPEIQILTAMPDSERDFRLQMKESLKNNIRLYLDAQKQFNSGEYKASLNSISKSLDLFETDYGLAFKGSVMFMLNDPKGAYELWLEASERDPSIAVPNPVLLNRYLRTD